MQRQREMTSDGVVRPFMADELITASSDADASPPALDESLTHILADITSEVDGWHALLAVSIGRAYQLTGMKEHQIRYFESLKVLQPGKTSADVGNRLYTVHDLRRLLVLRRLMDLGDRPATAAERVRANGVLIDSGVQPPLERILDTESTAVADGFLLARLVSQLLDAARAELAAHAHAQQHRAPRVIGVLLPMRTLFAPDEDVSFSTVQRVGHELSRAPRDMLLAFERNAVIPSNYGANVVASRSDGRDDTTVLFYSRDVHAIPHHAQYRYLAYVPAEEPQQAMVLILDGPYDAESCAVLCPHATRRSVFDRLLSLCALIFRSFSRATPAHNYRYRSDGFQIAHTRRTYQHLLATIRQVIFPDDTDSMAVILTPDSLDHPTSLAILSDSGYDDQLARRARLDLTGDGQGLSGRAYVLREPFLARDARRDTYMKYAMEEDCEVAFAIPFVTSWGLAPFGVLYLASRRTHAVFTSEQACLALILANILSEQMGRWWLTRLRRQQDWFLHERMDHIASWLDSLGDHGPGFQNAIKRLHDLWLKANDHEIYWKYRCLSLIVLDIDSHRERVQRHTFDLVPLRAQHHVQQAIQNIVDVSPYWFKNDHACLVLEEHDEAQAHEIASRIAGLVRTLPFDGQDAAGRAITMSVSTAVKTMTYRDLLDLDRTGGAQLDAHLQAIIDDLRKAAH